MCRDILKELWRGNIRPFEKHHRISFEIMNQYRFIERTFIDGLNDEQRELFDKFQAVNDTIANECEYESFADGFCLGAGIMLQIVHSEPKQ